MDFGDTTVIRDLSFDVCKGETFGFLGSNGSGKTTTIRALLDIYTPTAGTLLIDGHRFTPARGRTIGYLPEERGLYKKERVIDTMVYFGQLKGLSAADAKSWSLTYLDRVGIADKATVRLDKCSGGQQQKVQLGVTIMGHPDLLILDEPTKGFDPVNRRLLMNIIDEQRQAGATIVMVTHQMDEVERICDRILLLKDGTARAYGTVQDVQNEFGGTTVLLTYAGTLPPCDWYEVKSDDGAGHAELALAGGVEPAKLLLWLLSVARLRVEAFTPNRRSLDSIFIEVYGDQSQEESYGEKGRPPRAGATSRPSPLHRQASEHTPHRPAGEHTRRH